MKNLNNTTKRQELARRTFYKHLDNVQYEVWICEQITLNQAEEELKSKQKQEIKQDKIYKMPIIGKMIYNSTVRNYENDANLYKLMISLMRNLKFEKFDDASMDLVMHNKEKIYNTYYKNYYEAQYCIKEVEQVSQ